MQVRDVNSKTIFDNPVLCAQFVRRHSGVPALMQVRPEDIRSMSNRYHLFDGVASDSDVAKQIAVLDRNGNPTEAVVLIEHKSAVDYNSSVQMMKYQNGIWENWRIRAETSHPQSSRSKRFRFPPVLAMVYYEGTAPWTADLHLKDRIQSGILPEKYIPNYRYRVVRIHDFTTEQLLSWGDELSLLMMINKIQRSEDFLALRGIPKETVNRILEHTPESVREIIAATVRSMCRKVNVPEEDARQYTAKIKEGNMGYLFENMEKMDIQAERANTQRERELRLAAEARAETAEKEIVRLQMLLDAQK